MRILGCDINVKSYTLPILKIILSVLLIVLVINRGCFINIQSPRLNIFLSIVSGVLTILAILVIYLSIGELILLNEHNSLAKADTKTALNHSEVCSVNFILSLLQANSIIEIVLISENQIIRIGASSDCLVSNSHFFDKEYYIDDVSGFTFEEIKKELVKCSNEDRVHVISIDGILPKHWKSKQSKNTGEVL